MPGVLRSLGEIGRAEYNGFRFNGTTKTQRINIKATRDRAGRTIIYNVWEITLVTWLPGVNAASPTDPVVQDAVNRLNKDGGTFYFEGRGIGNPAVNLSPNTGLRDVKWGPKAEINEIVPAGRGKVCKITWTVSFAIPNCLYARYIGVPLELSYTVSHDLDDAGMLTRTIAGQLVVPTTRRDVMNRFPTDSADLYREQITPPALEGFRRRFQPFTVNEDRTTLSFGIIDEEMGRNPPPPKVVEVSFAQSCSSSGIGLMNWSSSFNGRYRMRKRATGYDAAKAFWDACTRRLTYMRDALKALPDKAELIPTGYSASEVDAHGKTDRADFSLSVTFICKLKDLIRASGLWQPLGTDYKTWAADMADGPWNPYGNAKVYFKPEDDYIVDACDPGLNLRPREDRNEQALVKTSDEADPEEKSKDRQFEGTLRTVAPVAQVFLNSAVLSSFPKPAPERSWLYYVNELFLEVDNGFVPVTLLPTSPLGIMEAVLGQRSDLAGVVWDALSSAGLPVTGSGTAPPSTGAVLPYPPPFTLPGIGGGSLDSSGIGSATSAAASAILGRSLRRTKGTVFIYMRGYAIRAGYRVTPPRLTKVNDVTPEPANRLDRGEGFGTGIHANGMHPLYIGRWNLRYYLPKEPTGELPLPPNPILGSGDPAASTAGTVGATSPLGPLV